MSSRAEALRAVQVGDVIYGIAANWNDKLLLVDKADRKGFSARHITTQLRFRFGRDGRTRVYAGGGHITIVSTAMLSPDQYEAAIGLDRKMAARPEYPDGILSLAERRLLLTHADFFEAHLLPGTEALVQEAERHSAARMLLQLEWDLIHARDNPPGLHEYDGYLTALVDLVQKQASINAVTDFLADMAARRGRPPMGRERDLKAAASLLRLGESWRSV